MRTKTSLLAASLAFLVLGIAATWYAWRLEHAAAAALAAYGPKRAAIAIKIQQTRDQLAASQQRQADEQARAKNLRASLAATQAVAAPAKPTPTRMSLESFITGNPKLLALYLRSFQLSLRPRFTKMYQKLGLTPEQIDKFEELAIAHERDNFDLMASADAEGLAHNDPGIQAMRKKGTDQFNATVAAAIGTTATSGAAAELNRSAPVQASVNYIAMQVAYDSQPLTDAQATQLIQMLANTSPVYQNGGTATAKTVDWQNGLAQAAGILTPAQLRALTMVVNLNTLGTLVNQFNASQGVAPK